MAEIAECLRISKGQYISILKVREKLLEVIKFYVEYTQRFSDIFEFKTSQDISTDEFFDIMFNLEQSASFENFKILDKLFPPLDFNLAMSELMTSNPLMKEEMTKYYKDSIKLMADYFESYKTKVDKKILIVFSFNGNNFYPRWTHGSYANGN